MADRGGHEQLRTVVATVTATRLPAFKEQPARTGQGERPGFREPLEPLEQSGPLGPLGPLEPRDRSERWWRCGPRDGDLLERLGNPALREVRLTSLPESASTARRLTLCVLWLWGLPQLSEVCELLVSELVGNAVRHTGARRFGLRMTRRRGWVRMEVRDPSHALPCLLPVRPLDISGRGLFLVDRLSDRWGVELLPRGKTTWFEIRIADR